MANVTIANVELLKTGTWQASTGEVTITRSDLEDMLTAWESRRLPLAVIKIGHTDPRYDNPEFDGEPAYGQVDNLRIEDSDDGVSTLVGDYINVPSELAEKLASAYPQRSVEIDWKVELRDESNEVVEAFPAVLTAVALLGATPPAVKGLADVHAQFKQRKSSLAIHHAGRTTRLSSLLAYPGEHTSDSLREALSKAVRDAITGADFVFVEDFDDQLVWYSVETYEDGAGFNFNTYQRTYTLSDAGAVTLTGDPVPVQARRTYKPVPPDEVSVPHAQTAANDPLPMDAHQQTDAASSPTPDEGELMEFSDKQLAVLRAKFGLSEDATNDDVLEALNTETANDEGEQAGAPAPNANEGERQPVSAANSTEDPDDEPTTVTLSQTSFAAMQDTIRRQGAQLAEITEAHAKERRDKAISVALTSGRIHPQDKDKWRKKLDKDEDGTLALLSELTPVIPTTEAGSDFAESYLNADTVIDQKTADLDDQMFGSKGGK